MKNETSDIFRNLNSIEYKNKVKGVQGKKYIPWNTLWAELCKNYPDAKYEFHCDNNGIPYFNSDAGIFVKVSVTINDICHTMIRPVYNNSMKSMRINPYSYFIKDRNSGAMVEKNVNGANADDVNDALMRCFAKAMAMHGNGLFVYEGKPTADYEPIDSVQLKNITKLCSDNSINISELNEVYSINKLPELAAFNYDNCLMWIDAKIKGIICLF